MMMEEMENGSQNEQVLPLHNVHITESSTTSTDSPSFVTSAITNATQNLRKRTTYDQKNVEDDTHPHNVPMVTGYSPSDRVMALTARVFDNIIKLLKFVCWARVVTSRGCLKTLKEAVITLVIVFIIAWAMHSYANTKLVLMKAKEDEAASCHVCFDTAETPNPPCLAVTESDFTKHAKKMDMLVSIMTDHINHDDDICMTSFHVGSHACAVAFKGTFKTYVYFNPLETQSQWDDPSNEYMEDSDFFQGKQLVRRRPRSIVIKHLILGGNGTELISDSVMFVGKDAACVAHVMEVMNGTHHELYSA